MKAHPIVLVVLLVVGCNRYSGGTRPHDPPAWVDQLIASLASAPVASPPASVLEYERAGAIYYFLPQSCCDQWSTLYDEAGTIVCHPDGGIDARGDRGCPDFLREAHLRSVVWQDPRTESPRAPAAR